MKMNRSVYKLLVTMSNSCRVSAWNVCVSSSASHVSAVHGLHFARIAHSPGAEVEESLFTKSASTTVERQRDAAPECTRCGSIVTRRAYDARTAAAWTRGRTAAAADALTLHRITLRPNMAPTELPLSGRVRQLCRGFAFGETCGCCGRAGGYFRIQYRTSMRYPSPAPEKSQRFRDDGCPTRQGQAAFQAGVKALPKPHRRRVSLTNCSQTRHARSRALHGHPRARISWRVDKASPACYHCDGMPATHNAVGRCAGRGVGCGHMSRVCASHDG